MHARSQDETKHTHSYIIHIHSAHSHLLKKSELFFAHRFFSRALREKFYSKCIHKREREQNYKCDAQNISTALESIVCYSGKRSINVSRARRTTHTHTVHYTQKNTGRKAKQSTERKKSNKLIGKLHGNRAIACVAAKPAKCITVCLGLGLCLYSMVNEGILRVCAGVCVCANIIVCTHHIRLALADETERQ